MIGEDKKYGVAPFDFRREVAIGHLLLDTDAAFGGYAKVNPPIRSREDVEYLWRALIDGKVHQVVPQRLLPSKGIYLKGSTSHGLWL